MSEDVPPSHEGLRLVKDVCRTIARQPAALAMIRATHPWPRVGVEPGSYVVFEEMPALSPGEGLPLNGRVVVVARLAGNGYHYVGHVERLIRRNIVSIRLDDGTTVPQRSFALRGSVVLIARDIPDETPSGA